jgi:DNA-binding transcriptional ArsR family regulator
MSIRLFIKVLIIWYIEFWNEIQYNKNMRTQYQPTVNEIRLSSILHALSDPHRLQVVKSLHEQVENTCTAIFLGHGIPKSTLTHHLKVLRESGLAQVRVDGTKNYYSLRLDDLENLFPGLMPSLLQISPELLE